MFSKSHSLRIVLLAVLASVVLLLSAGTASAQTDSSSDIDPYVEVEDTDTTPNPSVAPNVETPEVKGVSVTRSSSLPLTGGEIMGLVFVGFALVGGGAVVLVTSKRRHAVSS